MTTTVRSLAASGLLFLAAGCAPAGPAPVAAADPAEARVDRSRRCFHASSVNGFQVVDARTVDLTVGANRVFRVELSGTCPDVQDSVVVGIRTRGGSDFICDDNDVELVTPRTTIGPRVCSATSLRLRTPAELEAERRAR